MNKIYKKLTPFFILFLFLNSVGDFINLAALISPIRSEINEISSNILFVISYGGFIISIVIVSYDSIKDNHSYQVCNECVGN